MIGFLSKYAVAALAIALLATLAALGVQSARLSASKQATAEVKAAWATDRANAQALAVKTLNEYLAKEQEDQAKIRKGESDYAELQAKHAVTVAAKRAADDQLRNQVAAFAAPSGGDATSDTTAACVARAEALGVLVSNGLRVQTELAAGAETASDSMRTLLATWPSRGFEVPEKRISHEVSPIKPRAGP